MTNTLYDALIAPHAGDVSAFLESDNGTTLSYAAFVGRVAQLAHVLRDVGVAPGDRVVMQAPKLSDTLALYGAALQAGAVYLPLNTGYTRSELSYFIEDAAPALVVCDARNEPEIADLCAGSSLRVLTLASDGGGSLSASANTKPTEFRTVPRGPDDLAALLYTSGTTGRSKGAMLSHGNLLSNACVLTDLWRITGEDRLIHALPIFHTHGLFVAMNTSLLAGARVRFMAGFDVDTIIAELPRSTMLMGVPTFYTRLLEDARLTRELCSGIRLFVSGSAPLLAETHAAFEARTGHRILERYGMTETNMITSNPFDGERMAGTVGYPLPGTEVEITYPVSGEPIPRGETGMIEVRGDNVFKGYWNMPEKTKEELRQSGFFITGDLGVITADGRVSIVGRQKDLIISGGYNIYPKEIEDVVNEVEGVLESAVFGVPHADFGESVLAAVVAESGKQVSGEDIAAEVEPRLARFKHPRRYILMDALPRNAMGKNPEECSPRPIPKLMPQAFRLTALFVAAPCHLRAYRQSAPTDCVPRPNRYTVSGRPRQTQGKSRSADNLSQKRRSACARSERRYPDRFRNGHGPGRRSGEVASGTASEWLVQSKPIHFAERRRPTIGHGTRGLPRQPPQTGVRAPR